MPPLVSFIIPVRNDAARLQLCLTSVVANDFGRERIEIIVVDHGSTDGSVDTARTSGAVVLNGTGNSVAALRNQGAGEAAGEILAFVDADHQIDSHWIQTAVEILTDPQVGATGSDYSTQPSPTWVQRQYDSLRRRPRRREDVTWLGSGNLAMRSAIFQQVGGFDSSLTACEDVDLCNRVRLAGYRIVADPQLRSVHYGDPVTLKALFFGELWRGRDNIRVTLAGPRTLRDLRSALIPVSNLILLVAAAIALVLGDLLLALVFIGLAMVPAVIRATTMARRQPQGGFRVAAQSLTVALVFDFARALALVARSSHRARRTA